MYHIKFSWCYIKWVVVNFFLFFFFKYITIGLIFRHWLWGIFHKIFSNYFRDGKYLYTQIDVFSIYNACNSSSIYHKKFSCKNKIFSNIFKNQKYLKLKKKYFYYLSNVANTLIVVSLTFIMVYNVEEMIEASK